MSTAEYVERYEQLGLTVVKLCKPVIEACTCDAETRKRYPRAHALPDGQHAIGTCSGGLCDSPGKHPVGSGDWEDCNVGIVTGDQVDVLDIDGKLPKKVQTALPTRGAIASTGRGHHMYFAPPSPLTKPGPKLGYGEWLTNGKIVVAPPSLHASGTMYAWTADTWEGDLGSPPAVTVKLGDALAWTPPEKPSDEPLPPAEALEQARATLTGMGFPFDDKGEGAYRSRCPVHAPAGDTEPHSLDSLSLRLTDDALLVCCFAGCGYREVASALGISARPDRQTLLAAQDIDLADILDKVREFVHSFIWMPDETYYDAVTLWIAHTWVMRHLEVTARLRVSSATPRSGKSRLLEAIGQLVPSGGHPFAPITVTMTNASLFRTIGPNRTHILDEMDQWFDPRKTPEILAVMNSGYRRGGVVERTEKSGDDGFVVVPYETFGALTYAGIGDASIPDTLRDRSIHLLLSRKTDDERKVREWRTSRVVLDSEPLKLRLEAWGERKGDQVGALAALESGYDADIPNNDRAKEVWRPLLIIGDLAGDAWRERAEEAARIIGSAEIHSDGHTDVVEDLWSVWPEGKSEWPISAAVIALTTIPDADYGRMGSRRDQQISPSQLGKLLAPFGIRTVQVNLKPGDKGYKRGAKVRVLLLSDLEAAYKRYFGGAEELAIVEPLEESDGPLALVGLTEDEARKRAGFAEMLASGELVVVAGVVEEGSPL